MVLTSNAFYIIVLIGKKLQVWQMEIGYSDLVKYLQKTLFFTPAALATRVGMFVQLDFFNQFMNQQYACNKRL